MVTENTIMHLSSIITDNTCMLNIHMLLHQVDVLSSTCTKSMTSIEGVISVKYKLYIQLGDGGTGLWMDG